MSESTTTGGGEAMGPDQVAAAYEARVASVPEHARRFAEETWGETWAHAEMGSLLDFAKLLASQPAPVREGVEGLVPAYPTEPMIRAAIKAGIDRGTATECYRAMVAAAPPVPEPVAPPAGEDLAALSAEATPGEWVLLDEIDGPTFLTRVKVAHGPAIATFAPHCGRPHVREIEDNARFVVALVNAYRSGRLLPAPTQPAAQGEPVAWLFDAIGITNDWQPCASVVRPPEAYARSIRPLYEAPPAAATGRPSVDEVAAIIDGEASDARRLYAQQPSGHRWDQALRKAAVILDMFLATDRGDGTRAAGDGWRDISTAPKDGTVFLATCLQAQRPRASICWADGDRWLKTGKPEKFVDPLPHRWWPTHWCHLPPLPAAGDRDGGWR